LEPLPGNINEIRAQARHFSDAANRYASVGMLLDGIHSDVDVDAGGNAAADGVKAGVTKAQGLVQKSGDAYLKASRVLYSLADQLHALQPGARAAWDRDGGRCVQGQGLFGTTLFAPKTWEDFQNEANSLLQKASNDLASLAASAPWLPHGPSVLSQVGGFFQQFGGNAIQAGKDIGDYAVNTVVTTGEGVVGVVKYFAWDINPVMYPFHSREEIQNYEKTASTIVEIIDHRGEFIKGVFNGVVDTDLMHKDPAAWIVVTTANIALLFVGGEEINAGVRALDGLGISARAAQTLSKIGRVLGFTSDAKLSRLSKLVETDPVKFGPSGQRLSKYLSDGHVISLKPGSPAYKEFESTTHDLKWEAEPLRQDGYGFGGENAASKVYSDLDPSYHQGVSNQEGIDGYSPEANSVNQVKTIDPSAASYSNPAQFYDTLNRYANKLESYNGGPFKGLDGFEADVPPGIKKQLTIGIPDTGLTDAQAQKIADLSRNHSDLDIIVMELPR
jgi:hypothetical protein